MWIALLIFLAMGAISNWMKYIRTKHPFYLTDAILWTLSAVLFVLCVLTLGA